MVLTMSSNDYASAASKILTDITIHKRSTIEHDITPILYGDIPYGKTHILNLTKFIDYLLPFLEDLCRHRLNSVDFCHPCIHRIEDTHNLVRVMTIFLAIASDRRWGYSLVCSIEDPVSKEGDIRTMKSHRTRNIELPSIYCFTKLREQGYHGVYASRRIIDRIMKISNSCLRAYIRKPIGMWQPC